MIIDILTALVVGYILFEFFEHVLLPLVWLLAKRKQKSHCGTEALVGKVVEVRSWRGEEGRVIVDGELWSASGCDHLKPGDKAYVQKVEGLVLIIGPPKTEPGPR
jgi:membrane protein implicated in regulation of membrane protease activity